MKTIPFTAAHTYIAHVWQYPPGGQKTKGAKRENTSEKRDLVCRVSLSASLIRLFRLTEVDVKNSHPKSHPDRELFNGLPNNFILKVNIL